MPASSPRALGALVAGALLAGVLGAAASPAAAAPATPAPAPTAAKGFAGPPPETESSAHVHAVTTAPRTAAATAAPKVPAVPAGLPTALEPLARYVAQADCDPATKPGAVKLGTLLTATYPNTTFGGGRACTDHPPSEHYDGRAVDWMNSVRNATQKAQADAVLNWLFAKDARGNAYANARRLGVMYIIWNNRIWGSYDTTWQPYSNCASTPATSSDTACHRDHMHFSLSWEGAMGRTSFWTKAVAAADFGPCRPADLNWAPDYTAPNPTTCPRYATVTAPSTASAVRKRAVLFSGAQLTSGDSGAPVVALQNALKIRATGTFDAATVAAVKGFQTAEGLPARGVTDAATWRALLAAMPGDAPPKVTARLRTFDDQTGVWTTSTGATSTWGTKGDVPVPGDYDGNGTAEDVVYRPATGQWVLPSATRTYGVPGDVAVPGRYVSTRRNDLAVFRPSTGTWYVSGAKAVKLGAAGDIPVPADYDGDGLTERAVFSPSTGTWTVEGQKPFHWGGKGDVPVPADYNGDRKADIAVFRPSTSQWRVVGATSVNLGRRGDVPVPMRYDAGTTADRAVWRPSTGEWYVLLSTTVVVKHAVSGTAEVPLTG
jgi:peptidoglycan hydrolase-like protein with peptidoglycan-binding domain